MQHKGKKMIQIYLEQRNHPAVFVKMTDEEYQARHPQQKLPERSFDLVIKSRLPPKIMLAAYFDSLDQ